MIALWEVAEKLMSHGVTGDALVTSLRYIEEARGEVAPSNGAERTRRYRQRLAEKNRVTSPSHSPSHVTSHSVTNVEIKGQNSVTENVTEASHEASDGFPPCSPPSFPPTPPNTTPPLSPLSSTHTEKTEAKNGKSGLHELPADFQPDAQSLGRCAKFGIDPDEALDELRDWAASKKPRYHNWQATFRNLVGRMAKQKPRANSGNVSGRLRTGRRSEIEIAAELANEYQNKREIRERGLSGGDAPGYDFGVQ